MDVFLVLCVFASLILASRAYPAHRSAWVVGQWLAAGSAIFLLTLR